jgi:hypothetical protein
MPSYAAITFYERRTKRAAPELAGIKLFHGGSRSSAFIRYNDDKS